MSEPRQLDLWDTGDQPAGKPRPEQAAVLPAEHAPSRELANRLPPKLRLGTSSWSFPGWSGIVYDRPYPPSRLARHGLAAYAKNPLLRAVGIDRTHYAPLPADELRAYHQAVPEGFRFLIKAHEACTLARFPDHPRYGARAGQANPLFLDPNYAGREVVEPFIDGLGSKGQVLLFQFARQSPADIGQRADFAARLRDFLQALPNGPRYAIELRDRSLMGPEYCRCLAETSTSHCLVVQSGMLDIREQRRRLGAEVDGSPLVVRWLLGFGLAYDEAKNAYAPFDRLAREDDDNRRAIAELCHETIDAGGEAIIIINNKAEGCAPLSVVRLAEAIVGV